MFGLFALMGAIVAAVFVIETRAQVLERVSLVAEAARQNG
jgi:hypothetical protein